MANTYGTYGLDLLDPFFIGFNRELSRLGHIYNTQTRTQYPPYNVVQVDDNTYSVDLALAGFQKHNISVSVKENTLIIDGMKEDNEPKSVLHKGISSRKFTRMFGLGEHMEVQSANFVDGLLSITVVRNIPEEKKPKVIEIQ